MFIPNYYKNENNEEVKDFLKGNSFGILINQADGKLTGTHITIELEKSGNSNSISIAEEMKKIIGHNLV
ncbi:MAG: FMN-binding negative transcriptional regulator [Ginsengibacter sp.]